MQADGSLVSLLSRILPAHIDIGGLEQLPFQGRLVSGASDIVFNFEGITTVKAVLLVMKGNGTFKASGEATGHVINGPGFFCLTGPISALLVSNTSGADVDYGVLLCGD